ncbi:MAG: hypothetical protein ACXAE3_02630 [Candidatus Kariarchaeaceae archaeon]|jgi:hypothetical protein
MIKFNIPFLSVLTIVWLILLALCALIGILIVPVNPDIESKFLQFLISSGKVGLSLLVVGLWLFAWYRAMDLLLKIEFYLADTPQAE